MIKKLPIILALFVLIITISLSGRYSGFERGYEHAAKTFAEIGFSGETIYTLLRTQYIYIVWGMFFFLLGKSAKSKSLSQLICFPSLVWALYVYWQIYQQKSSSSQNADPFYEMLQSTTLFDWLGICAVSGLLIYQISIILKQAFRENKTLSAV